MNFSPGGVGASDCLTTVVVGVELGRPRPPPAVFQDWNRPEARTGAALGGRPLAPPPVHCSEELYSRAVCKGRAVDSRKSGHSAPVRPALSRRSHCPCGAGCWSPRRLLQAGGRDWGHQTLGRGRGTRREAEPQPQLILQREGHGAAQDVRTHALTQCPGAPAGPSQHTCLRWEEATFGGSKSGVCEGPGDSCGSMRAEHPPLAHSAVSGQVSSGRSPDCEPCQRLRGGRGSGAWLRGGGRGTCRHIPPLVSCPRGPHQAVQAWAGVAGASGGFPHASQPQAVGWDTWKARPDFQNPPAQ